MNIRFLELEIVFRQAEVLVPFSPELTFIYGQLGVGKSSIASLADWCLGGNTKFKYAVDDELISAALLLSVNGKRVRVARDREDKGHVRLSWDEGENEPRNEVVPLQAEGGEWDPTQPQTLSDYLFVLAGVTPVRVPRSAKKSNSPLQRLSFRDFLSFCYLPQEKLTVSLLRFGDIKARKSQDVMRALLGLFSERQQRLQAGSDSLLQQSKKMLLQAEEVTAFLDRLEIDDLSAVEERLMQARQRLEAAKAEQRSLQKAELPPVHPVDEINQRLEKLSRKLALQRQSLSEVEVRLGRDQRLRAELITAQLKVERSTVAVDVLANVHFGHCPQCGTEVTQPRDPDACSLCHRPVGADSSILPPEAAEADLQSRIEELATSISRHQLAQRREKRRLKELEEEKGEEDDALARLLENQESKRLAAVRDSTRRVAVVQNEVERYESANALRSEVVRLKTEGQRLAAERLPILEELEAETAALEEREETRSKIANVFKEALLEVGMPDLVPEDTVTITDELVPIVQRTGGGKPYGFEGLSSGMRTLFQCCYALAIHRVAAEENLLLPRFLIIDTPTQNIDEHVDGQIFHGFFRYLYSLMLGPMKGVQVLLIDHQFERPPEGIEVEERFMQRANPEHPRLVPYVPAGDPERWDVEEQADDQQAP